MQHKPAPEQTTPCPMCGRNAVKAYDHDVYCSLYRPYGSALFSVCFEPGDPGYDEASELKLRVQHEIAG